MSPPVSIPRMARERLARSDAMVDLLDLRVTFTGEARPVRAVDGDRLQVQRGEAVTLIGESGSGSGSGSGKRVTPRALLRLHNERSTRITGAAQLAGQDVLALGPRALADFPGRVAAMIFQEPLLALDPVYTLGGQIAETVRRHVPVSASEARQRALALFEQVRIPSPERRLAAFPHEMSGGMRQRAVIALALDCRPQLLLAGEPTTALDATVQSCWRSATRRAATTATPQRRNGPCTPEPPTPCRCTTLPVLLSRTPTRPCRARTAARCLACVLASRTCSMSLATRPAAARPPSCRCRASRPPTRPLWPGYWPPAPPLLARPPPTSWPAR